ncbi:MAG: bifunctional glutamate N-acetyltransferase/amino-acid acetyltransferase ArgJ [Pirellulales bacterium]
MSTAPLIPQGYKLAGVHCGLKKSSQNPDLALFVSDRPAAAAGVYTQNLVFAASVAHNRGLTPAADIRAVVVNSGNANAATGERGLADARRMAALAAEIAGAGPTQALVMQTGIIGEFMAMPKFEAGIAAAANQLAANAAALDSASRGLMTTDTVPKVFGRQLKIGGGEVRVLGLAKGAAMIGPNMATMLGLVLTDAAVDAGALQEILSEAVDDSFNCISVDGHMSTNDTVLLLANGTAGVSPEGAGAKAFAQAVREVCADLAEAIIADGEGATHLIELEVRGCAGRAQAHRIAKTVAESPLVKTAVAGADPNWGRIVSAAGYAGVAFRPEGVRLTVNGFKLFERGAPLPFDADQVSTSIRDQRETKVVLEFSEGDASVRFLTTDLTAEYVRLNADYHT